MRLSAKTVHERRNNIINGTNPSIFLWLLQKNLEVFITFLVLIPSLTPFRNGLSVEDKDVEESIEKEDVRGLNGCGVKEHGLASFHFQGVGVKGRLNHDKGVTSIFMVEDMAVECSLIR